MTTTVSLLGDRAAVLITAGIDGFISISTILEPGRINLLKLIDVTSF